MDNIKNWLSAGVTLALMSATIAPAAAQTVRIINGVVKDVQPETTYIYTSPIPAPIPINHTDSTYIDSSQITTPIPINQTDSTYIDSSQIATPIPINQTESSYIYISPIGTPIPFHQVTKHRPHNNNFYYRRRSNYYHPRTTIYSPPYQPYIINPGSTYPNVVNPIFRNKPLRNPVFEQRYRYPQYRQPFRGRTGGIRIYIR